MMLEPFDDIVKPLISKMSSDEDQYFTIPTDRTVKDLQIIIENRYPNILKINFEEKKIIKIFGLFQKIKRNQGMLTDLKKMAQS